MRTIFRKRKITPQESVGEKLTPAESGGLLIINIIGLCFFFTAATITTSFFFLYLAYVLNVGAHIYERGLQGTMSDLKAFFRRILPI